MCLWELNASGASSHCRLKRVQSHNETLPRCVAYTLQEPLKKELKTRTTNTGTTRSGKMAELCNSFVIVPKCNGMVCLCLDPGKTEPSVSRANT